MTEEEADPFGPDPTPCFECGKPISNGTGITPDGLIAPGIVGRVFCPECWKKSR